MAQKPDETRIVVMVWRRRSGTSDGFQLRFDVAEDVTSFEMSGVIEGPDGPQPTGEEPDQKPALETTKAILQLVHKGLANSLQEIERDLALLE